MAKRDIYKVIYPFYSLFELSEFIQYSRQGTHDLLIKNLNLPYHFINNKYIFYISELQLSHPSFYNSIILSFQLNKTLQLKKSTHKAKIIYSIYDLKLMLGITLAQTKSIFDKISLPYQQIKNVRYYYLADIQNNCKILYNSILLSIQLNELIVN